MGTTMNRILCMMACLIPMSGFAEDQSIQVLNATSRALAVETAGHDDILDAGELGRVPGGELIELQQSGRHLSIPVSEEEPLAGLEDLVIVIEADSGFEVLVVERAVLEPQHPDQAEIQWIGALGDSGPVDVYAVAVDGERDYEPLARLGQGDVTAPVTLAPGDYRFFLTKAADTAPLFVSEPIRFEAGGQYVQAVLPLAGAPAVAMIGSDAHWLIPQTPILANLPSQGRQ